MKDRELNNKDQIKRILEDDRLIILDLKRQQMKLHARIRELETQNTALEAELKKTQRSLRHSKKHVGDMEASLRADRITEVEAAQDVITACRSSVRTYERVIDDQQRSIRALETSLASLTGSAVVKSPLSNDITPHPLMPPLATPITDETAQNNGRRPSTGSVSFGGSRTIGSRRSAVERSVGARKPEDADISPAYSGRPSIRSIQRTRQGVSSLEQDVRERQRAERLRPFYSFPRRHQTASKGDDEDPYALLLSPERSPEGPVAVPLEDTIRMGATVSGFKVAKPRSAAEVLMAVGR
ncbi:hypothetical protein J8273_8778 [Carpediemonas membranifera]|uniref:Uncharacterized protein n=1 Tax=Carpediemonas membranifera TaxID=201153 RepID=A0A8J6DYS2_9EUKA|nr:hypothetical protein J8273_8778 [Carpediemonas membranifera]|eukprot:KAG9389486.1 hypothetical protein J8273_8778 [Carpediemonas membranifera]